MNQRLQKILSAAGVASRRASETMIQDGRVTINGQVATVGMSADPDVDVVAVDGTPITISERRRYIILNKPKGYVTTMKDDRDRPTVAELVTDAGGRLYPVGRLDMDSEGLLLMTDDGAVANALMHPSHEVNKVYTVFVQGMDITASLRQLQQMEKLDGEPISRAQVMLIERKGTGAEIQMTIHEGKNRQIRRMCQACGLSVSRLIRVAEGPIVLGELPLGKWRNLTSDELSFLHNLV
jgi:23S rRNA pseudouridine2605 synthase